MNAEKKKKEFFTQIIFFPNHDVVLWSFPIPICPKALVYRCMRKLYKLRFVVFVLHFESIFKPLVARVVYTVYCMWPLTLCVGYFVC